MANRQKRLLWDPALAWEANIEVLLAAQAAARRHWSASVRRRQMAGRERARKRKRKAALRRLVAWYKVRRARGPRPLVGLRRKDAIVRAMVPGLWHALPDLMRETGIPKNTLNAVLRQKMIAQGLAERGRLPDGAGVRFRLTPAGELLRRQLDMLD